MRLGLGLGLSKGVADAAPAGDGSLQDAIASACMDLDVTKAASYDGSSQEWLNLVTAPADGSDQSDYDYNVGTTSGSDGNDPTYNGTGAGDIAGFWGFSTGDYFTIKTPNPVLLNNSGRSGGQSGWAVVTWRTSDTSGNVFLFDTRNSSGDADGNSWRKSGAEKQQAIIDNTGGIVVPTGADTIPLTTDVILIYSWNGTNATFWTGSATGDEVAGVIPSDTTLNSNQVANLMAAFSGANTPDTGTDTRLYSFAFGNEYLNDTKAAAIIDFYETRHSRDYTP